MKKTLWILLVVALSACSPELVEETEASFEDGTPQSIVTYALDGDEKTRVSLKEFYPGGTLKIEGSYEDDKRHGVWHAYFEDGTIQSEYIYDAGSREGACTVYHSNGQIYYMGQWHNDEKTGVWKYYTEDGGEGTTVDHTKPQ